MNAYKYFIFALTSLVIVLTDQITKWVMLQQPQLLGTSGDFFRLTLVFNRGVAFSLPFNGLGWYIALLLLVLFIIFMWRKYFRFEQNLTLISLGLLAGGAGGNLIDKIRFDAVVDFIKIGPWPLFNVADIAITLAVILMLIFHKRILRQKAI